SSVARNGADRYHVVAVDEGSVQAHADAAACLADYREIRDAARLMIDRSYALRDERRENIVALVLFDGPMDTGRKDDPDVVRHRSVRDQTANEEVYDLCAARRTRRIGHDDQDAFARRDRLFEWQCTDRLIELFVDRAIVKRRIVARGGKHRKALFRILERHDRAAVVEIDRRHRFS